MIYYILPSKAANAAENDYRIMRVNPEDQVAFLTAYGDQVIAQGSSIAEALQQFGQWQNQQ